jgi:hypothetical protein
MGEAIVCPTGYPGMDSEELGMLQTVTQQPGMQQQDGQGVLGMQQLGMQQITVQDIQVTVTAEMVSGSAPGGCNPQLHGGKAAIGGNALRRLSNHEPEDSDNEDPETIREREAATIEASAAQKDISDLEEEQNIFEARITLERNVFNARIAQARTKLESLKLKIQELTRAKNTGKDKQAGMASNRNSLTKSPSIQSHVSDDADFENPETFRIKQGEQRSKNVVDCGGQNMMMVSHCWRDASTQVSKRMLISALSLEGEQRALIRCPCACPARVSNIYIDGSEPACSSRVILLGGLLRLAKHRPCSVAQRD